MSHSFEGVRLIKVSSGSGNATPDSEDSEDGTTTEIVSPSGKITVHKHSSGDNDYLAVPLAFIVLGFVYLIVRAGMAPFHKNRVVGKPAPGGLSQEEIAILHKLERTLSQMESRVEALETILIDQNRTAKNYGSKF